MNEKKNLIMDYILEEECFYMFDCNSCVDFEECYMKACERCDIEFAKSVDYGGYNTEEEYWSHIFD